MSTPRNSQRKEATPHPRRRTKRQDEQTFDLGQQIAELRGVVIEGFKGVHQRQDIANGRTGKLEIRMEKLENDNAVSRGRSQGRWRLWLVLTTIAGLVIALLTIVALSGCWGLICK